MIEESQETLAKKQQISRILDIDIELQNEPSTAVRFLNGTTIDVPVEMTKEQYHELTKITCRKRNLSVESEGSSESQPEKPFSYKDVIYVDVCDEDSLQRLALKYNCHVQELKVANKIYNNIDLHALKTIKIPVVKDGQLYDDHHKENFPESINTIETFAAPEMESKYKFRIHNTKHEVKDGFDFMSSEDDDDLIFDLADSRYQEEEHLLNDRTIHRGHLNQPMDSHDEPFHQFIERKDKELEIKVAETELQTEKFDELQNAMPAQVVFPAGPKPKPEQYGSVCSFTWSHVLFILCLVAVVAPLLYFIYFKKLQDSKKDKS